LNLLARLEGFEPPTLRSEDVSRFLPFHLVQSF
jgi:hypothetical protein